MANKKDRIMDLMRRGIITEDEALELLEKNGSVNGEASDDKTENKEFTYTDKEGYVNHDVDFPDAMKNVAESLFARGKEIFQGVAKSVDDNIDFSKGFPKVKSISHTIEKDINEDFKNVNLNLKSGKVNILPGENAHVKVEYKIYGAVEDGNVEAYIAEKTKLEVEDDVLEIEANGRISADIELYLPVKEYENIELEELIIDNMCMQLVTNPERFKVIVTMNLYGDILSDLVAGLVGGLGVAPGANIGDDIAIFEAVHGSAPDIAGQNKANPLALLLSSIEMLKYLKLDDFAKNIERAILKTLTDGYKTADLGGNATTTEFTDKIIENLK